MCIRDSHCTDGNMATHIKKLIHFGFIVDKKEVVNNKLQTTYSLTKYGKEEFVQYVNLLNSLL